MAPYRKPYRKPFRKRRIFRKRKYQTRVRRPIVPKRTFVKLSYESGQVGTTTTTTMGVYQFKANSIYDPDSTGIGHQPRGHDEWSAFFRSYRVHGVLVEVTAMNLTPGTASILSIFSNKSASYPTLIADIMELPDCKFRYFTSEKTCYIKRYISMTKIFGKRKAVVNDDLDFQAEMGADPVNLAYVTVNWINMNEAVSTGHNIRCKLTYYVELTDPKMLTNS